MKITAQHKAILDYERTLEGFRSQGITHEQGLRPAFQHLLLTLGREVGWTIFVEQKLAASGKRPDATLRDGFFDRGYWEAKDTRDDLNTEIRKKLNNDGYPSFNIIFEDTRQIVLYQNGQEKDRCQMRDRSRLAQVLELFFTYSEPPIEEFHLAVREFKERIPDLAQRLLERIREERAANRAFVAAFEQFHALCQQAINPQISLAAIEEMLVQHLLTERLFRTVFDNPDFITHNVIAIEIEKVITALTSRSFNRNVFLKGLDKFYTAIETAARDITDWSEKQAFMNIVYERFFQGFAVKQADTYGIVYTPQQIVDFMVASVDDVLRREFGKDLSAEGVQILDPATGTGSYIVNILRRVSGAALERKYRRELFANEIMLLPYYIASLNIERAYYDRTGHYLPFEGICFADTLDLAAERHQLSLFSEANTDRIERESQAEITVIIGNPPYNVGQVNENDNNKNRQYKQVDGRVRDTYAAASKATNKNALSDVYVKFFRWATDRLGDRDGIVCFVSNNSFLSGIAFDGFRKHLLQEFTQIYHFDFKGNARTSGERRRAEGGNIFDDKIRVGVGITILVRSRQQSKKKVWYHSVGDFWPAARKREYLHSFRNLSEVSWQPLIIDAQHNWLVTDLAPEFTDFLPIGSQEAKSERALDVEAIFKNYGRGVATSRDDWAYDYNRDALIKKIKRMIETYNTELDRWKRRENKALSVDDFVTYDDTRIKWSRDLKLDIQRGHYAAFADTKIRLALYRPFCKQWLFFDRILNEEVYQLPQFFPTPASEAENNVICVSGIGSNKPFQALMTNIIPCLDLLEKTQCFPYYTYAEDGSSRRENITDWALKQFQAQYGNEVGKRDIFHYVYALLHHPQYRQRYAENLKRELPRIPLLPERAAFDALVQTGAALAHLSLHYEQAEPSPLPLKETPGERFTYTVKKMRLAPDRQSVIVNDAITLAGIPPACFDYRLGNRSALEWVIDQYQVSTDPRSGITSDPNRADEPDYIVNLLRRVVTVSLATVKIVAALPDLPDLRAGP
ncbi:MAG TPA: type ISP restriction/modification enzyme [Ktedonobacterales bacterium]|jgi:predicted helicase